jgi:hypothetical protein
METCMKRVLILLLCVLVAGCGAPDPHLPYVCREYSCEGGISKEAAETTEDPRYPGVVTCPHCNVRMRPRARLGPAKSIYSDWGILEWVIYPLFALLMIGAGVVVAFSQSNRS